MHAKEKTNFKSVINSVHPDEVLFSWKLVSPRQRDEENGLRIENKET